MKTKNWTFEKILSKQSYGNPVEQQALYDEEAKHVYELKMHCLCTLTEIRSEIYEDMRIHGMSTTDMLSDMRENHGLNTNQFYYELRETKKTEIEITDYLPQKGDRWDWLNQS